MKFNYTPKGRHWKRIRTSSPYKVITQLSTWCDKHESDGAYFQLHPCGIGDYPHGPTTLDWYFENDADALLFVLKV